MALLKFQIRLICSSSIQNGDFVITQTQISSQSSLQSFQAAMISKTFASRYWRAMTQVVARLPQKKTWIPNFCIFYSSLDSHANFAKHIHHQTNDDETFPLASSC